MVAIKIVAYLCKSKLSLDDRLRLAEPLTGQWTAAGVSVGQTGDVAVLCSVGDDPQSLEK